MISFDRVIVDRENLIFLKEVARLPLVRVSVAEEVVKRKKPGSWPRWQRGSFVSAPALEREMFDRNNHIA